MSKLLIIVEQKKDWGSYYPSEDVITASEYLAAGPGTSGNGGRVQVINLCRNYKYLSAGYYCSLLAEARSQRVMPSVRTINDLSQRAIYSLATEGLDQLVGKSLGSHGTDVDSFTIKLHFGKTRHPHLQELARQVFELFPCPLLEVSFRRHKSWHIASIKPGAINLLSDSDEDRFAEALDSYSRIIWRKPRSRKKYRYEMAILHNPENPLPPSDRKALANFVRAGRKLGIDVELVTKRDVGRLAEFDALFIRETTAVNHYTYRFAKKAESEGMVVIDDSSSILRCTNKVYLAELLQANKVPTPRTVIMSRGSKADLAEAQTLGLPLVLKIPDGSFSRGVHKVSTVEELEEVATKLFHQSTLVLAQEYLYTEFDWRVGVLNGKPIFVCKYFMSKGHWQIYNHAARGKEVSGGFETIPVSAAPVSVVRNAVRAAKLLGNSLYGVDMKLVGSRAVVIEVNDNPNIDSGVEDLHQGLGLYMEVMGEFVRRLERKRVEEWY